MSVNKKAVGKRVGKPVKKKRYKTAIEMGMDELKYIFKIFQPKKK